MGVAVFQYDFIYNDRWLADLTLRSLFADPCSIITEAFRVADLLKMMFSSLLYS